MTWLGICFCISNACSVWLNRVGRDRETKEEHHEDCLRGFSVFKGKISRRWWGRQGGRRDRVLQYQYLRWIRTETSLIRERQFENFENNFPTFLLSGNSNASIFKTSGVHWVHFLVIKSFSNISRSTFCWIWASNVWT